MQKTILIFGGGENQLTLIKAAKKLCATAVVIDPDPQAPGKEIADHFEVVGPSDYDFTKEIALRYKIDGIVTSQMENPLMLMARLAEELNFVFPSREVIRRCRNKYLMKQAFLNNGIQCAKGILIRPEEEIDENILLEFLFPVIIKPVDSFSSRGVYKINSLAELKRFEMKTRSFSSDHSFLIEEFIDGKEYSVESLTFNGKTHIIQITEKIITAYPYTVEIGHIQPANLPAEVKLEVIKVVTNAIRALGIDNSAAHTELKITDKGPVIIEIGARLGGDFIASYLTLASTGINMDEGAINIALGNEPDIAQKGNQFSCIKYLELPPGKVVTKVKPWKDISELPSVIYALLTIKEGQVIPALTDSAQRVGFIMVQGKTRNEVIRSADEMVRILSEKILYN